MINSRFNWFALHASIVNLISSFILCSCLLLCTLLFLHSWIFILSSFFYLLRRTEYERRVKNHQLARKGGKSGSLGSKMRVGIVRSFLSLFLNIDNVYNHHNPFFIFFLHRCFSYAFIFFIILKFHFIYHQRLFLWIFL